MIGRHVFLLLAFVQSVAVAQTAQREAADTVFRAGSVYTVDANRRWAEAVAVRSGRIVYVGTDTGLAPWIGPRTQIIDLKGKMLLPGFHDSHVHLVAGGTAMGECDLHETTTVDQVLAAVKQFAERHPGKKWINGGGWPLTIKGGPPHKSMLDKVVPDRPVALNLFEIPVHEIHHAKVLLTLLEGKVVYRAESFQDGKRSPN